MSIKEKENINTSESEFDLNADENMSGLSHLNDEMTDSTQLDKLEAEIAEWKDKYTRLFAEFDNYKKRAFKEKMETIQTAGKDILLSMLDVLDDMERAEKQIEVATDMNSVKEGINLVFTKLKNTMQQKGLKAFDSIDQDFDVEKHEAVSEIPVDEDKVGKVIDELQKGYTLNDKMIRYAKVVVGKSKDQ